VHATSATAFSPFSSPAPLRESEFRSVPVFAAAARRDAKLCLFARRGVDIPARGKLASVALPPLPSPVRTLARVCRGQRDDCSSVHDDGLRCTEGEIWSFGEKSLFLGIRSLSFIDERQREAILANLYPTHQNARIL